jgi:rare lipoprotein A
MGRLKSLRSGLATWYGKVLDRHRTASGEIFDSTAMTGASNTLPFGTRVQVTNLRNGRSVVVRVNDRGILAPGNIIDITSSAANKIGLLRMGIAPVHLEVIL